MSTPTPAPGSAPKSTADLPLGENYQVPNSLLHAAFGELNVLPQKDRVEIVLTVMMEPVKEGAQTGVALDGSASMQLSFGHVWEFTAKYDNAAVEALKTKGLAKIVTRDGAEVVESTHQGWDEMIRLGYVAKRPNQIEAISREVIPYLADRIDADGGTTAVYWACGPNGDQVEVIGDLTSATAQSATYPGPKEWGHKTQLLPALRYFINRFKDAPWGFYVFVTDGRLDDLDAVKQFTAQLAHDIAAKKVNAVKCVLVGVGKDVDESQLEQLDDLPDTLDLPVDIWDHKMAGDWRNFKDIFAEVLDENAIVAPTGKVFDEKGNVAAHFADGVPSLMRFALPAGASQFTLEVADSKITQRFFP